MVAELSGTLQPLEVTEARPSNHLSITGHFTLDYSLRTTFRLILLSVYLLVLFTPLYCVTGAGAILDLGCAPFGHAVVPHSGKMGKPAYGVHI